MITRNNGKQAGKAAAIAVATKVDVRRQHAFSVSTSYPGSFLDRDDNPHIRHLKSTLSRTGIVTCVWGESKSGKTTYLRHLLETTGQTFVIVAGPRIKNVQGFWRTLGEALRLDIVKERQHKVQITTSGAMTSRTEASVGSDNIAKASASLETRLAMEALAATTFTTEPLTSARSKCIEYLRQTSTTVIVDDAQQMAEEVCFDIAYDLKEDVEEGAVRCVFVAIEDAAFDFIYRDEQLIDRFRPCAFPNWTASDLKRVARSGFSLVNLGVTEAQLDVIVANAALSPYNLQDLALNICANTGIRPGHMAPDGRVLGREELVQSLKDFATRLSYFHLIIARAAERSAERLTTYEVEDKRLNLYELALLALNDCGGQPEVKISVLKRKIRERLADPTWSNPHLAQFVRNLASTRVDKKFLRASTHKGAHPLRFREKIGEREERVLITNPLFKSYLFWYLPTALGVTGRDLSYLEAKRIAAVA